MHGDRLCEKTGRTLAHTTFEDSALARRRRLLRGAPTSLLAWPNHLQLEDHVLRSLNFSRPPTSLPSAMEHHRGDSCQRRPASGRRFGEPSPMPGYPPPPLPSESQVNSLRRNAAVLMPAEPTTHHSSRPNADEIGRAVTTTPEHDEERRALEREKMSDNRACIPLEKQEVLRRWLKIREFQTTERRRVLPRLLPPNTVRASHAYTHTQFGR